MDLDRWYAEEEYASTENNYLPVPTWEQYEIAKNNGISKCNVDQRIIRGWNILKAITRPVNESFMKKYKKELAIAEENGIGYRLFRQRIKESFWEPIEAATVPRLTKKEAAEISSRVRKKKVTRNGK
ncbi:hypothetical protein PDN14_27225 [Bacillus cereus group sp. Bc222]|uniref:hypothetical protein n=1 Tax=Bacillus TaxID=1386 RepID=UPI000C28D618|nr:MULTISPECIES: hypothetical protein [Bacillus]AYY25293.1 hypothetical protein EGX95_01535 [Bacillus sp. FDAARGOS_527]MDA2013055.1 hypothetical protein [Bacillus cereus group sp. Bcc09]MDA2242068.1 hypothetical protein [Bacillus cereus group sp. Bc222]HDR7926257.1 hypothetical protein [Bacillus paranthracis]